MASPEKEEKGEFEDYHVTEEELPHTGWEMREARFDPYQEAYEVYELEDGQTNEMFSKGEISSQEKEIGLLHHKSKYLNTCIRKMEIDYEGRKKQIMDIMERSLEDKISQDRKQFFIEEMIKLRQSIEANRKEEKSVEIQLRNLTS